MCIVCKGVEIAVREVSSARASTCFPRVAVWACSPSAHSCAVALRETLVKQSLTPCYVCDEYLRFKATHLSRDPAAGEDEPESQACDSGLPEGGVSL